MNIEFRKPTSDEVFKIYQHYVRVIDAMQAAGIDQWDSLYPNAADIAADIDAGDLIVAQVDGKLVAAVAVNNICDPEYDECKWQYPHMPYITVHRLAINPKYWRKGVGRAVMEYIESDAKEKGIKTIRLDTFCGNPAGAALYENLGFKIIGYTFWRKGKFQIMEKVI